MAATTDPLAPGLATTEGKLAAVAGALGVAGAVVPVLWTALSDLATTYPQIRWLAAAVSVLSVLWTVLGAMGYAKQRTALKVAAIQVGKGAAVLLLIGATGCAALSHVSGSTGSLDLGKGYVCTVTAGLTDAASCTKTLTTECLGPNAFRNTTSTTAAVHRLADGSCP